MGATVFWLVVVVSLCWGGAEANSCTKICDTKTSMSGGYPVKFCGMDGQLMKTYSTTSVALELHCYIECGVAIYHPGPCGCPNDCYSDKKWGQCDRKLLQCNCRPDRGGADCSAPRCPSDCSGHGVCMEHPNGGVDTCLCFSGWTTNDCSVAEVPFALLPFGAATPEARPTVYWKGQDPHQDDHPVFNLRSIATVRVNVAIDKLQYLFDLDNIYTQSYVEATLDFDNGRVQQRFDTVGFRIKGSTTRWNYKHGFAIDVSRFDSDARLANVKKFGIKAGSVDINLKDQIARDFMRTVGVAAQRSCFAAFYLNDFFAGLYWMHEDDGEDFLEAHFGTDASKGSLYQPYHGDLSHISNDPVAYREATYQGSRGPPFPVYEKALGKKKDFTDLATLILNLNTLNNDDLRVYLKKHVDVLSFIRSCAMEAFMQSSDHYMHTGKNYLLYNEVADPSNPDAAYWHWALMDFDATLRRSTQVPDNVYYFLQQKGAQKAMAWRVFQLPEYKREYTITLRKFLDAAFTPDALTSRTPAQDRWDQIAKLATPVQMLDKFWETGWNKPRAQFQRFVDNSLEFLTARPELVRSQLVSVTDINDHLPVTQPEPTVSPVSTDVAHNMGSLVALLATVGLLILIVVAVWRGRKGGDHAAQASSNEAVLARASLLASIPLESMPGPVCVASPAVSSSISAPLLDSSELP